MKSVLVICFALVALEAVHAQVIRSVAPGIIGGLNGCGCGCGNLPCASTILAPAISPCSSIIAPSVSPCGSPIIPSYSPSMIAPQSINTVVQPSVAASLADTLSLLTVSSLLAETLPLGPNVMLPPCGCGMGMGYGGYFY